VHRRHAAFASRLPRRGNYRSMPRSEPTGDVLRTAVRHQPASRIKLRTKQVNHDSTSATMRTGAATQGFFIFPPRPIVSATDLKSDRTAPVDGKRSSRWGLPVLSRDLFTLLRHVVTDHATDGRADQTVVMGVVARDAADDGSFDAALCIGRNGRDCHCQR
jgi:hypothetical protein